MSFTESSSSSDSRDDGPVSIFWGCELSGAKSSYTFHVPEDWNCEQQLVLRTICLGETARDEFHVVEVSTGDGRTPVPLATLKPSVLPTASLAGLELNPPVTFHLRAGSGPVYVCGQHVSLMLLSSEDEDEEEEMEEPPKKPPRGAQRSSTTRGRKPEKEAELRRNLGPKAPLPARAAEPGGAGKPRPKMTGIPRQARGRPEAAGSAAGGGAVPESQIPKINSLFGTPGSPCCCGSAPGFWGGRSLGVFG